MERYAHIREDSQTQTVAEHLRGTAELAEDFAGRLGFPEWGKLSALLHDLGKYSDEFQDYISSGDFSKKGKIDHATAGAQFVRQIIGGEGGVWKQIASKMLAIIIAWHHGGLPDTLSSDGDDLFQKRMEKADRDTHLSEALSRAPKEIIEEAREILSDEQLYKRLKTYLNDITTKEIEFCKENLPDRCDFALGMLVKMLYSCLVDADRCDTADFSKDESAKARQRSRYLAWEALASRLEEYLQTFSRKEPLSRIRADISDWSKEAAKRPRGIFTMTVPTGGGKTLASLRFALEHAKRSLADKHPIERIIYVIPYTTIIEQNAKRVREILEKSEDERGRIVLECHANLLEENDTQTAKVLSENWDAPVIFTTNVQFLEAIFSRSPNRARRMHQLANSVIIFDEIQTLPIKTIHLFCSAVNFIAEQCGASVLLCTATQPLLSDVEKKYGALRYGKSAEIVSEPEKLFKQLKRVKIYNIMKQEQGGYSTPELAEKALGLQREFGSLLVILNTTSAARNLYKELSDCRSGTAIYHMSAQMCPAHREKILGEIILALAARKPLICVATSVMEAGVDADFACVMRSCAGYDSIVQAAGRCNREGRAEMGFVYIVNPSDENLDKLTDVREGRDCARRVIREMSTGESSSDIDLLSLDAIERYFRYYFYNREGEKREENEMLYQVRTRNSKMNYGVEIDRDDNLLSMLSSNKLTCGDAKIIRQSFATAGEVFSVIDAPTESVIVPYGEGAEILSKIGLNDDIKEAKEQLRRAQRYSVNIYPYQMEKLKNEGAINKISIGRGADVWVLAPEFYDESFGVSMERTGKAGLFSA